MVGDDEGTRASDFFDTIRWVLGFAWLAFILVVIAVEVQRLNPGVDWLSYMLAALAGAAIGAALGYAGGRAHKKRRRQSDPEVRSAKSASNTVPP